MKGAVKDGTAALSPIEAAELLVAELRGRRKQVEQLIRLVKEQADLDLQADLKATETPRASRPLPRYKCRNASTRAGIADGYSAGAA